MHVIMNYGAMMSLSGNEKRLFREAKFEWRGAYPINRYILTKGHSKIDPQNEKWSRFEIKSGGMLQLMM